MPRPKNIPKSLDNTPYHADDQDENNGENSVPALIGHTVGQYHAVHGNQGADGDINTACQHDTGHAGSYTDQTCIRDQNVQEVLQMCEPLVRIHNAAGHIHGDEQNNRDHQKQTVSGKFFTLFRLFHHAASFTAALFFFFAAAQSLNTGLWNTTIRIMIIAMITGDWSVETPIASSVVMIA